MNRKEHMYLSEKIGKLKGTTNITVSKDGVYNENVGKQYTLPLEADGQHRIQKEAAQ